MWHGAAALDTCAGTLVLWELGGELCTPNCHSGLDAEGGPAAHRGASPTVEVLARMPQGRVHPSTDSPEPIERVKKVKAPQQALVHDVNTGSFRGVMFASVQICRWSAPRGSCL